MADIDTAVIRDLYGAEFADGTVYDLCAEVDALRARLAEVLALCDEDHGWDARRTNIASADMADRLAEVEALCDEARSGAFDSRVSFESAVRAAARGEGAQ